MQITAKEQSGLAHSFHVVVSASEVEAQMENELLALGKKVKMPGFRPGKVPLAVLKQKYSKDVMGDVLQSTITKATRDVVEQKKLRPALQPDVKIVSFEDGQDLAFDITLEVLPEIPAIDFAKITVDELTYELPEAEVAEGLQRLAKTRQHTHAHDGAAEMGHVVKIDFLGKKDGEPFEGGAGKGFQLELGSNQFIPGFEAQLVGMNVGDKRTISVTFPKEYHSASLAGAEATFDVTVHEVLRLHAPDVDDKLAESLGFKDLENLKSAVRQQIDFEYKGAARAKAKKQLFDALDEAVDFEIPASMLKLETENILKQVEEAKKAGDPELKDKSDADLRSEYEAISERRVRLGILLSDVARSNNLQITREELSSAVMSQARNYPGQEDKVFEFYRKNPQQIEELRGPILEEKAVDFILSKVTRKPKAVTIEELMKDDEGADKPTKKAKKKK
ncbi:MAG: trigger factor [Alphaproteobacteria bacterium]|nr:trigger factor [Alphaproteobacteria bacterium]